MHSGNQFDFAHFLTLENFRLAFQRLQTAPGSLYKELYHEDLKIFGLFLEENIKSLLNEIEQKIFKPENSYKIFLPKKNNLVRPFSLLKFKDLLIYQAVINTISDSVYDEIYPYYNNLVFGNSYNPSKSAENDKIFFFKRWKDQWKIFEQRTKEHYESGYEFLSEFDIASFFDTIDHHILHQILETHYQIDPQILTLLSALLEAFTGDSSYRTFRAKHGIPQGPIGSSFLADLYLLHLDLEMKESKLDIRYIRYVDDIRIFSKNKITSQRAIAYLDLLSRDLGLIPQVSKILFAEVNDIDKLLRHQKSKLSAINKEYKKKGSLRSKTHQKLKERFLNCFDENSSEEFLDKTLISFSLYKLNSDEDIKAIILKNWESLYIHFEAILFYLKEHFLEDQEVKRWLVNILLDENLLFHNLVALILKFFPEIEFIEDLYKRYMVNTTRHWLVQYFMFHWLYNNKKFELITSFSSENYFLNREAYIFKFRIYKDSTNLSILATSLLKNKDCLVALHGLYLYHLLPELNNPEMPDYNHYIRQIISQDPTNYIEHILKNEFLIENPRSFFESNIWSDKITYDEVIFSFREFFEHRRADPSKSLLNLNGFNNLVYDKICHVLKVDKPANEYGVNLNSGCIKDFFPITNKYFTEINEQRNQRTEAHPYNKHGELRIRIDVYELENLFKKQKKALEEICGFDFRTYL